MDRKTAALLVSFGTSCREAGEKSLGLIYRDLAEAGGIPFYQAYTSGMIIRKISPRRREISTVREAVLQAVESRVKRLLVIPTHMIPGSEFQKLERELEIHRPAFEELKTASPVLAGEEDCERLIPVLRDMLGFCAESEYILMGHGTEDRANIRYEQMNRAFEKAGLGNVRVACVEAKPDLEEAIRLLPAAGKAGRVTVHPFMVVAGEHARNDMAGERDSYLSRLRAEGYRAGAVMKGLGEYPQFRRIYVDKLRELMGRTRGV